MLFVIAVRVLVIVVLLAGPGARMMSADTFLWTVTGRQEGRFGPAIIHTALVVFGFVAAKLLTRRALKVQTA